MLVVIDPVLRIQRDLHGGRLAVRHDGPRESLGSKILGHCDREDAVVAPGLEMRRLALVGTARIDPIVRTDGNVELLIFVTIEVPDQDDVHGVLARTPALECGVDGFARHAERRELKRQLVGASRWRLIRQ